MIGAQLETTVGFQVQAKITRYDAKPVFVVDDDMTIIRRACQKL